MASDLGVGDGPLPEPDERPLMILTTGTSGTPKGVRHDWSRLLRAVSAPPDKEHGGRWLLAYNLNQFAGIQVLLHALRSSGVDGRRRRAPARRRTRSRRCTRPSVTHVERHPDLLAASRGRLDSGDSPRARRCSRSPSAARPRPTP